jgi:hypothetical protein
MHADSAALRLLRCLITLAEIPAEINLILDQTAVPAIHRHDDTTAKTRRTDIQFSSDYHVTDYIIKMSVKILMARGTFNVDIRCTPVGKIKLHNLDRRKSPKIGFHTPSP